MTKIRIGLNGANGRMCSSIAHVVKCGNAFEIAFGVDKTLPDKPLSYPVYQEFSRALKCDVVIDFSEPFATMQALDFALLTSTPIVVATTGHNQEQRQRILQAGEKIPIFFANNTSIGNYLMLKLASCAASFLDDGFDVEIVETHHRIKADAPSGTAIQIADAIRQAKKDAFCADYSVSFGHATRRKARDIGIHSVRGGSVVGKHEVLFLGDCERLTITHEAENKSVFVHGALKAAAFILHRSCGVYGMDDLLSAKE